MKAAREKRQKVYKYIMEHPNVTQNKEIAAGALGFDTSDSTTREYSRGVTYISDMIRKGFIAKHLNHDGEEVFYVTGKEPIECAPVRTVEEEKPERLYEYAERVKEAKEFLDEKIEEHVADNTTYSGCLVLTPSREDSEAEINLVFENKTKDQIVKMLYGLNLEDIL